MYYDYTMSSTERREFNRYMNRRVFLTLHDKKKIVQIIFSGRHTEITMGIARMCLDMSKTFGEFAFRLREAKRTPIAKTRDFWKLCSRLNVL